MEFANEISSQFISQTKKDSSCEAVNMMSDQMGRKSHLKQQLSSPTPTSPCESSASNYIITSVPLGRPNMGMNMRMRMRMIHFPLLMPLLLLLVTTTMTVHTLPSQIRNLNDIPDPPGRPLIMGFTSRSVNLSWTQGFDNHHEPDIQHYIINVRKGENGEWDLKNALQTYDNRTNHQVDGLEPFTVYSFRVVAVNFAGHSYPSKESYYTVTLREVPIGKAVFTSVANSSSTSIVINWSPPALESVNGEFLGFRIKYRPRDPSLGEELDITIRDPDLRKYTIKNLLIYTEYIISLQVFNPAGEGPASIVTIMTDEGTPSAPLNLTAENITDNRARLRWESPQNPNAEITGYRIYIHDGNSNFTDSKTMIDPKRQMDFTLRDLKPFTDYKVFVKAITKRTEGQASRTKQFQTDVQGPSPPRILNLTCDTLDSLFIQWERPLIFYKQIDYYLVYYKAEESRTFEEITVYGHTLQLQEEVRIVNLTANTLYEVKVRAATNSVIHPSLTFKGDFSEPRKVVLQSKCQSYSASPLLESNITGPVIAGALCASFALILVILSFILWRKYFQAAYYYLDDPPSQTRGSSPQLSETYDECDINSVPVSLWSKHVQDLHADGDIGFSREYEAIQAASEIELPCEHSLNADNKPKNRYVNIVAYDHSRVMLKPMPGQKAKSHQDYINGNYIDGYNKARAYIGTQGPLPSTFEDYWRMIWEQRVCIIVMITNLVERGRRKCDMYWPKEGSETYGIISVKLLQEVIMATYTLRTFTIRNSKIKKKNQAERTVYQYHYTNWPDHGVPDHPLPVLSFVRKSSAANPPSAGPIIVHCSAGVGRTGTYIVIDAMLKQIKHRQSLNSFGFLKHIRQQRNYLVQTEEQYIFIHDALLEAIESADTEVPSSHLSRYIQTLQTGGDTMSNASSSMEIKFTDTLSHSLKSVSVSQWPLLERQYKMATSFRAKDFNVVSALKSCNKGKNRSLNLIPLEGHRVHITPRCPGTDGSDYINGTFFPGFNHLKEFIVTQHPVFETTPDFWQMVWDHNTTCIVCLSSVMDEKEFPQFWPEKDVESDFGSFKVKLTEETTMYQETGGYITTRDFIMQSTQDDYELTCRLIHCPSWPESCGPLSSVFDLIKLVQDWQLDQAGPVIVVDRYGGTEAATFCCLTTLYKQLNFEDCIDVYMFAKLYHLRRPGIWRSQDDYLFLYRAMESLVSNLMIADSNEGNSNFGSQLTVTTAHLNNSNSNNSHGGNSHGGNTVKLSISGETTLPTKLDALTH